MKEHRDAYAIEEPVDKASGAWKSWALMQVGADGFPVYWHNLETLEIEEANY